MLPRTLLNTNCIANYLVTCTCTSCILLDMIWAINKGVKVCTLRSKQEQGGVHSNGVVEVLEVFSIDHTHTVLVLQVANA